jgi:broad specificity phosphatase PhoE
MYVVTLPEVRVEPDVPVPQWGLSALGRHRLRGLLQLAWVDQLRMVFSSDERKALDTAEALADRTGLTVAVDRELGENDRSSTGFLPAAEFEALADRFFAEPAQSVRGWETALQAQRRVVAAVGRCLARSGDGDVAVVTHGAVGTLLWCHLSGRPVDRRYDQPGQGSWYAVELATMKSLTGWQRLPLPGDDPR